MVLWLQCQSLERGVELLRLFHTRGIGRRFDLKRLDGDEWRLWIGLSEPPPVDLFNRIRGYVFDTQGLPESLVRMISP